MVVDDPLRLRALRAYEMGRLRSAARALLLLVPVTIVCAIGTGQHETCGCLGVLLLVMAVYLRWRSRDGAESVVAGALAGAGPLVVGLVIARVFPHCGDQQCLVPSCVAVCGAGLLAGALAGVRLARHRTAAQGLITSLGVGAMVAALGCVGLGLGPLAGAIAGVVVGGLAGRFLG